MRRVHQAARLLWRAATTTHPDLTTPWRACDR